MQICDFELQLPKFARQHSWETPLKLWEWYSEAEIWTPLTNTLKEPFSRVKLAWSVI